MFIKSIIANTAVIAIFFILGFFLSSRQVSSQPQTKGSLASIQTGPAPWGIETDSLQDRLNAIQLPVLTEEGSALHTHQHLDIFIEGNHLPIPAGIGINDGRGFISPIHTHDTTGIIHIESPDINTFTLGQFFDIWGVRFTDTCLGGYCITIDKTLEIYVNGKRETSNFRDITLQQHQEIVIIYGTPAEKPAEIPASYLFPAGD